MDLPTVETLLGLLTLLCLVLGALLTAIHGRVSDSEKQLSDHRVAVAQEYVTRDEHERRLTAEISSLKELMQRVESNLTKLLEKSEKGAS